MLDNTDISPFSITKLLQGQGRTQSARFADLKATLDFHGNDINDTEGSNKRPTESEGSTLQR